MLFTKKVKEAKTFDENGNPTEWEIKQVPRDFSKVKTVAGKIGNAIGTGLTTAVCIKVVELGIDLVKENLNG